MVEVEKDILEVEILCLNILIMLFDVELVVVSLLFIVLREEFNIYEV